MAVDPHRLLNWRIPEVRQRLEPHDAILYALGVGLGHDPLDRNQLRYVYEDGLRVLPTMATVLAHPGFWMMDPGTGIDWRRAVHGEQSMQLFAPLPVSGEVIGRSRVVDVDDKGVGTGLFVRHEREVSDAATGDTLCLLSMTSVCRGDGGVGSAHGPGWPQGIRSLPATPDRAPDVTVDLPTQQNAALIYRLSGDLNPLHADPKVAHSAGFERPILHGLCTFGVAGHALLRGLCDYSPQRLKAMGARFSAPVLPGETIRTEIWRDRGHAYFRCLGVERGVVVVTHGFAQA